MFLDLPQRPEGESPLWWPRWYAYQTEPTVFPDSVNHACFDHGCYSYVVLPREDEA